MSLNNMDADVNRFPAGMLLNSGCELQTDSWPLMQNNLILSMLPRLDSSDLVTTLPQHEQCFKSEAKHDLNTRYFGSSRTLLVSPDIELHEEDACELSMFSQSSSHAVTNDGNESDLVSKSEL